VVDVYKFLVEKVPESGTGSGETATSLSADIVNGIVYVGTSKGRLYKI